MSETGMKGNPNMERWTRWLEERNPLLLERMSELLAENEKLKKETAQLRGIIRAKAAEGMSMSSKLRNALRE